MPLGDYSKQEVRSLAEKAGIHVASKPDSQEICFVTDSDYADFIMERAESELIHEGNYVDDSGKPLGRHRGIFRYTVGQRKGLGISMGRPVYVKKICAEKNEVVLGYAEDIRCREIECGNMNFLSIPEPGKGENIYCRTKVRYSYAEQDATVKKVGEDRFRVIFDEPVRFAAPGQSAVFYDKDDCIIGGGIIKDVIYD